MERTCKKNMITETINIRKISPGLREKQIRHINSEFICGQWDGFYYENLKRGNYKIDEYSEVNKPYCGVSYILKKYIEDLLFAEIRITGTAGIKKKKKSIFITNPFTDEQTEIAYGLEEDMDLKTVRDIHSIYFIDLQRYAKIDFRNDRVFIYSDKWNTEIYEYIKLIDKTAMYVGDGELIQIIKQVA